MIVGDKGMIFIKVQFVLALTTMRIFRPQHDLYHSTLKEKLLDSLAKATITILYSAIQQRWKHQEITCKDLDNICSTKRPNRSE